MHACADESAGAREERPSKRSTPTESELADAPMLSDSDLMPPEMEGQLSEEAGNLPPPSEPPSAAHRSFHFKKVGTGSSTPDITDNLLNMDLLLTPSDGGAGGVTTGAELSATASTNTSQSHLPGVPEGAERAVLGGDMTARQSAISSEWHSD